MFMRVPRYAAVLQTGSKNRAPLQLLTLATLWTVTLAPGSRPSAPYCIMRAGLETPN